MVFCMVSITHPTIFFSFEVLGPPGTGKSDTAVQILATLYHTYPTQRTVIIAHSNAALNNIFQKVMARGDVEERHLVRLSSGERSFTN